MKTIIFFFFFVSCIYAQSVVDSEGIQIDLTSISDLELINVDAKVITHDDKTGIEVKASGKQVDVGTLVIIPSVKFSNGIITLELTGEPAPGADPQMRGFVGLAFRVNEQDYSSYECFYLRPTNARANNQIRRNHSTQYISHPEYPWYRLRNESPKMYESYVDLVPGEWTKVKIVVEGKSAKLFVHNADQPCLIVNDLKHGDSEGKIALWLHSSTLARFRNLVIYPD